LPHIVRGGVKLGVLVDYCSLFFPLESQHGLKGLWFCVINNFKVNARGCIYTVYSEGRLSHLRCVVNLSGSRQVSEMIFEGVCFSSFAHSTFSASDMSWQVLAEVLSPIWMCQRRYFSPLPFPSCPLTLAQGPLMFPRIAEKLALISRTGFFIIDVSDELKRLRLNFIKTDRELISATASEVLTWISLILLYNHKEFYVAIKICIQSRVD